MAFSASRSELVAGPEGSPGAILFYFVTTGTPIKSWVDEVHARDKPILPLAPSTELGGSMGQTGLSSVLLAVFYRWLEETIEGEEETIIKCLSCVGHN